MAKRSASRGCGGELQGAAGDDRVRLVLVERARRGGRPGRTARRAAPRPASSRGVTRAAGLPEAPAPGPSASNTSGLAAQGAHGAGRRGAGDRPRRRWPRGGGAGLGAAAPGRRRFQPLALAAEARLLLDREAGGGQAAAHLAGHGEGRGRARPAPSGRRPGPAPRRATWPGCGPARSRRGTRRRRGPLQPASASATSTTATSRIDAEVRQARCRWTPRARPGQRASRRPARSASSGQCASARRASARGDRMGLDGEDVQPAAGRPGAAPELDQGRDVQAGPEAQLADHEAARGRPRPPAGRSPPGTPRGLSARPSSAEK